MDITGSTNIKSFSKGESYKGLKDNHFDVEDRLEKGISKDESLEKLNKHFEFYTVDYKSREKQIEEYNSKPSQLKNKSRRYDSLQDYVEKRRQGKKVTKKFHGLEFMMVSKVGSMDSWKDVVDRFESHGVSEGETLSCLNDAFYKYCEKFNEKYGKHGLYIAESNTNLDEKGAPHVHSRLVLVRTLKNGLPDTNIANALKSAYGSGNNKELMERFRFDLDDSLVRLSSHALKDLAREHSFNFEGLNLIRTEAEEKGLTHRAYIERQELKRKQAKAQEEAESTLSNAKSEANKILDEAKKKRSEASQSLRNAIQAKRLYEQAEEAAQSYLDSMKDERSLTDWAQEKVLKSGKTIYDLYLSDTEAENKRKNEAFRKREAIQARLARLNDNVADMMNSYDESNDMERW